MRPKLTLHHLNSAVAQDQAKLLFVVPICRVTINGRRREQARGDRPQARSTLQTLRCSHVRCPGVISWSIRRYDSASGTWRSMPAELVSDAAIRFPFILAGTSHQPLDPITNGLMSEPASAASYAPDWSEPSQRLTVATPQSDNV